MLHWVRPFMMAPIALAAVVGRLERRTIQRLTDAGANTAERGILLEDGRLARVVRGRLERAGALRAAGNNRYYLLVDAYQRYRGRRRVRAWIVVTILMLAVASVYFSGGFA
jgi:hypothetical protein